MTTPRATILIPTKNRKADLAKAIDSALAQTVPCEVFVIDDGSTDGTSEFVRSTYPTVRLERHEESRGAVATRTRGVREASAPVVFSIDDDAVLSSPTILERTLEDLRHPRVGAVAVPYRDMLSPDTSENYRPPDTRGVWCCFEYRACAYAVRKELVPAAGGYRDKLMIYGEEQDFCLRLLALGYVTRMGNADPVLHYESPKRDRTRQVVLTARNPILLAWANYPMPYAAPELARAVVSKWVWGARNGYFRAAFRGTWDGVAGIAGGLFRREPVPGPVFRAFRWMQTHRATALEDVERMIGPWPVRHPVAAAPAA
jgi:glycosyltransferase involved in cell wall biosynthesis